MEHNLSIRDSLAFGWRTTRAHSTLIFQVLLTLFAVQIAEQIVSRVLSGTLEGGLAELALTVVSIVLGIGFTMIMLKLARGKHAEYAEIVPPFDINLAYFIANLLAGIIIILPLLVALVVCLIAFTLLPNMPALAVCVLVAIAAFVVALYFCVRYAFVRFAILDDQDITKSLRTSAKLTSGRMGWTAGFLIVIGLLNILGAILLLVGLLITIPVTLIAYAHVYDKLYAHHS